MIIEFIGGPFDGHTEHRTEFPKTEEIPKTTSMRTHLYVMDGVWWDSSLKQQVARANHESLERARNANAWKGL